jgi:hypothetical protein
MVRLARYVLLELALGSALAAGMAIGGWVVVKKAIALHDALASEDGPKQPAAYLGAGIALDPPPSPKAQIHEVGHFEGVRDDVLLAPIRSGKLVRAKFNHGGTSISMRLDFDDGSRAAFKPEQINTQTVPRKEVAAFRINRLLGLSSVAPAIGGRFTVEELLEKMDANAEELIPRFAAETLPGADGTLGGELAWWIPEITDAKLDGVDISTTEGILAWRKLLTAGEAMPPEKRAFLAQLSSMIAFDYLINNVDRWSGSNTKSSPDGQKLYFMDNTYTFGEIPEGTDKNFLYLSRCQRFSRALLAHVRQLNEASLRAALAPDHDPWDALLTEGEIAAVLYRRDKLIAYVEDLAQQYGDEEVLAFP